MSARKLFAMRKEAAWRAAEEYWLRGPLRHVVDVGEQILARVLCAVDQAADPSPVVVDMGFGDAWLLDRLLKSGRAVTYVGLDSNARFVDVAQERYGHRAQFIRADLEAPVRLDVGAHVVVNAFNFFELLDLEAAVANADQWLLPGGSLEVATIDRTFLVLALSKSMDDFVGKLRGFAEGGARWDFQNIDTGDRLDPDLEYPSVMHYLGDLVRLCAKRGLRLTDLVECDFTHRAIPKVYQLMSFRR